MKNNKKQIYLWGGLGNVIYQINFAYYLNEIGYKVTVNKSLINYNHKLKRSLVKIHYGVFENINFFIDTEKISFRDKLSFTDIFYLLLFKIGIKQSKFKYYGHDWPSDNEIYFNNNFLGYFQKTNIISDKIQLTFYKKYNPNLDKEILKIASLDTTILIHVRLGDKKNIDEFSINYTKLFNSIINFKLIIVVSDDEENARLLFSNFNNHKILFSSNICLLDDFYLISSAKNVIITRSSFSWWASEISDIKQIIYQPDPFYKHVEWKPYSNKQRIGYET
jgi:hypothetical protein